MNKDYYENALKGPRDLALQAIPKIEADLKRYGSSGHPNARKHQIIFSLNVLTRICQNAVSLCETAYFDIYVDIYLHVLAPKLEPSCSPSHWKRLLSALNYLFYQLVNYRKKAEAHKLYIYITQNQLKWSEQDDFKYLMDIHGGQLQLLINAERDMEAVDKTHLIEVFIALKALFEDMTKRCKERPQDCTLSIVRTFLKSIFTNSQSFQIKLATTWQCSEMERMYNAFLGLLYKNSTFATSENIDLKFQVHLDAIRQFMQMDIRSKLATQMALQYARLIRDIKIFKENEYIGYCLSLPYHFLKIAFVRTHIGNFKEAYEELTSKFKKLLIKMGKRLMQQFWFQEFFMLLFFLLIPMHSTDKNVFDIFWQQLDGQLLMAHIQFIAELVKVTPLLKKISQTQFNCCKDPSSSFHILLNYSQICLETYTKLVKKIKDDKNECTIENDSLKSINLEIASVLKHSIETLISMENKCSKVEVSIRKLCVSFAKLLQDGNHKRNASNFLSLATHMTRLRSRISSDDWLMIILRVNKIATNFEDPNVIAEILACYIAEMICSPTKTHYMILHNSILCYHYETPGICLYETYNQSTSPLKPLLKKQEKRYFHWLETQYISKFYDTKKDFEIFKIIALQSQTKYDFVLIAGSLLENPEMFTKVQDIYKLLRDSEHPLKRLQQLTLAHARAMVMFKLLKDYKASMYCKDFQETNIPQLLQEKSLLSLSLTKELEFIEMARESFHCFEVFFNKTDIEPLSPNDGSFLDWSRIIEDLTSLATYFEMTGYLDYALEAWLLHYRVSCAIDDVHSSLRSLTFFCAHNSFFETDKRLDIAKEIELKTDSILHILHKLPQLLKRQQNFTLICVCQIAYYCACQKQFVEAQNCLSLVSHLHEFELERENKYDIVRFTADMVSFRIIWLHSEFIKVKPLQPLDEKFSLLHQIDVILERLGTYVQISSADMQPYTILLFHTFYDFAEFAANRLCDNFLSGFLCSVLKLCVQMGMAVRTAQLLSKWVFINLQMEYLQRAEIKMQLIESILDLRDKKELIDSLKAAESCPVAVSKQLQTDYTYGMLPLGFEEVRKAAVSRSPALIEHQKMYAPSKALDYELKNCHDSNNERKTSKLCQVALWCRFTLSCLRARFNFLYKQNNELHAFYENCGKWLEKHKHTFYMNINQNTALMSMMHYANFLRASKDYGKAEEHLNKSIDFCENLSGKVDGAYLVNLKLQLQDTLIEQYENKTRCLPVKKKHSSIGIQLLSEPKLTPNLKTSKYAALAITSCKKSSSMSSAKSAAFVIYSDRKSPRKTQKASTRIKSVAAIKALTFSQSGESGESSSASSSRSSAERRTNRKDVLNDCPFIELSDSDDCDDVYVNKSKSVQANKPKIKLGVQKKTHFKFLESIELEELSTLPTILQIDLTESPMLALNKNAQRTNTKKSKTKRNGTLENSTGNALDSKTPDMSNRTRRLRVAQTPGQSSEPSTPLITSASLRRRQRN